MYIIDFSPNHENTSGKPDRIAIEANTSHQYRKALDFAQYYFSATFPNGCKAPDFATAKSYYHGNSKIYLSIFWNTITGKYEMQVTSRKIIKANNSFWKYNHIGKLTDIANAL